MSTLLGAQKNYQWYQGVKPDTFYRVTGGGSKIYLQKGKPVPAGFIPYSKPEDRLQASASSARPKAKVKIVAPSLDEEVVAPPPPRERAPPPSEEDEAEDEGEEDDRNFDDLTVDEKIEGLTNAREGIKEQIQYLNEQDSMLAQNLAQLKAQASQTA